MPAKKVEKISGTRKAVKKIREKKPQESPEEAVEKEAAVLKTAPVVAAGPAPAGTEEAAVAETGTEAAKGKTDKYYEAVGRRKSSIARVRLFTKGSEIIINGRPYQDYLPLVELQQIIEAPFRKMKNLGKFKAEIKVKGGGLRGQADAARHGISRALVKFNGDFRKRLKKAGFLTRDARVKERKKYGLRGARRAPQWQKR